MWFNKKGKILSTNMQSLVIVLEICLRFTAPFLKLQTSFRENSDHRFFVLGFGIAFVYFYFAGVIHK